MIVDMTELNLPKLLEYAGKNLKMKRIDKRGRTIVKISNVSKEVNIDPATISKIESGDMLEVKFKHLVHLGDFYGMTVEELFGLEIKRVFNYSQVNEADTSSHTMNNNCDGYVAFLDYVKEENKELKSRIEDLLQEIHRLKGGK